MDRSIDRIAERAAGPDMDRPDGGVIADGMRIHWDAPITMDDGVVLRADVFAPPAPGRYPVIMTYGPYGKGLAFQEGYKSSWEQMIADHPEIARGSSNKYQCWELVDPEKWVPDGYVCVRVDSRGTGRSAGSIDLWSPRETQDFHDCIEWAAAQPWSDGKVGLNGISYYAMNQWQVAALQPPHLTAICVWEGAADHYRDAGRHGGVHCGFLPSWFAKRIVPRQHGYGERGARSAVTGELVAGPDTLPDDVLARRRLDPSEGVLEHPLDDDFHRARTADLSRVRVPLLSSANWGGMGLHTRGNFEGYLAAASEQKWLEAHGDTHYSPFYTDEGVALQKRFFGHFLKGEDTGWDLQPPVLLRVRHPGERFVTRPEGEWPLARTRWTRFYLDPVRMELGTAPVAGEPLAYDTAGEGATFLMPALDGEMEITGPVAARLVLSSDTRDADVFLALRLFDPDGAEVLFVGTNDPRVPIGLGWLRASHRKLDPARSLPHRPFHAHDEAWPLEPGEPVDLEVEIWPTCIVVPPGYRLGLTVRGKDYDHGLGDAGGGKAVFNATGVGPFSHAEPRDRPDAVFSGRNRLHFDADRAPYLLLPVIPPA